ncbi:MAG: TRAP transporter small permease subunit [Pseudomonadota bacterium]
MGRAAALADWLNRVVGQAVRWLAIAMVLAQFAIVVGRYVFGVYDIAAQESVLYMHAALFMLAAGWTLQKDAHVRIDILYARASPRTRRIIDIAGHTLFLIPSMLALFWWSWPSVRNSWAILEGPISVGGIEAVFLMKSLIPAFCILLILQSLAILTRLIVGPRG